jgi:REP element-mobilizing transposase RayT
LVPRSEREWEPGGLYHLTPEGNDKRAIFFDDIDRHEVLRRCELAFERWGIAVLGYCLMTTHLHLLVRCGKEPPSLALQGLFGGYARWWNRRHGQTGHCFRNRCHAERIADEAHLWEAARYIDLNPVRAGIVGLPADYPWSSYRAHVGLEFPLPLLANEELMRHFGPTPRVARATYESFVRSASAQPQRRAA